MPAEPKTRPTDMPVADFIAGVEPPVRRSDAEIARALLEEVTGEAPVMWGPSIVGFGAYQGPTGAWPVIGFSPRKAQTVFYVMPGFDGYAEQLARLGKHKTGGSCLYVNKLADVDLDVLREIATDAVRVMRERYPAAEVRR